MVVRYKEPDFDHYALGGKWFKEISKGRDGNM
jgi:hypothetical protein